MLKNLSYRNAKRQVGKYIIYWGSLIGAISLIYGFNALVFSSAINELSRILSYSGSNEFGYMIVIFSLIIVFALGWFVSYMTDFMLRKRSREISTYMILGVEKKRIVKMLFFENIIIGGSALLVGWLVGIWISEILELIVSSMFHSKYSLSPGFSLKAAGLTLLYFCAIYFIAQIKSNRKINKMKLIDLLYYEKYNEIPKIMHTKIKLIIFLISSLSCCGGIYFFSIPSGHIIDVFWGFILIIICILFLFVGGISITHKIFEKKELWKYKKTHLFLYRLLSSKVNEISISLGIISALFTISISCIGMANAFYSVMEKTTSMQVYDISILHKGEQYDFSKYKAYLSKTTNIKQDYTFSLYTKQNSSFMSVRNDTLSKYLIKYKKNLTPQDSLYAENQFDTFIRYSDYLALRKMLNLPLIEMDSKSFIIHCMPYLNNNFSEYTAGTYTLKLSNETLTCSGIYTETFSQYGGYGNGQEYLIVIPDYLVDSMNVVYSLYVANTFNLLDNTYLNDFQKHFDSLENLDSGIVVSVNQDLASKLRLENMDYISGKYGMKTTSQAIILILPLFYMALIFCIIGTVILAVQLLSENNKMVKNYRMLHTLGISNVDLLKTLKKHVLLYFSLPLFPATLFGGILVYIFTYTMIILSFDVPVFEQLQVPIIQAVSITLTIFIFIYFIYIYLAYKALKKEILLSNKPKTSL